MTAGGGPLTRMPRGAGGTTVTTHPLTTHALSASATPSREHTPRPRAQLRPLMMATSLALRPAASRLQHVTMTDDIKAPSLAQDLDAISPTLRAKLDAAGFDRAWLLSMGAGLASSSGDAQERRDARNRVAGPARAPASHELAEAPMAGTPEAERLSALGRAALVRGELAFVVMAGGMATRMGGVVKALVEATEGKTFLELRLLENAALGRIAGRPVPLWLMTSDATDAPIREALARLGAPAHVKTFLQGLSLRLTPGGALFRDSAGEPSSHATGHGDLVDAVRRSGLLETFRKEGGKVVWITNLDNLGATVDPAILGTFLESPADVMVEVCDKVAGDKGGIPVHAEGCLQVLEEFRLPRDFDASTVRVFNTNTFLVRAEPLATAPITWNWFEVEKKVDGHAVVQFERLLQELTHALKAAYLRVPRDGAVARFLPVKDPDELARRGPQIQAALRARGIL
jgi:UTP--glucose-1-phosphate uridylyltransferase